MATKFVSKLVLPISHAWLTTTSNISRPLYDPETERSGDASSSSPSSSMTLFFVVASPLGRSFGLLAAPDRIASLRRLPRS